jgi:hypothetical protein
MTNRCVKEVVDFINVFQILPRHVSASGCHLQGVVGVTNCVVVDTFHDNWSPWTDHNPYTPTTQTLLE